jgi:NAD+ kinase
LNDVVVSRGGSARLIAVKASVDQELVGRYIADGLIVSTPTGSTGYSLSAGGPIVCPDVDCIVLSPICAHSLQHRPVVSSSKQTIVLELDFEPQRQAQLSIDGQEPILLQGGQKVTIVRSPRDAQFIRLEPKGFFQLIRFKLSEWSC